VTIPKDFFHFCCCCCCCFYFHCCLLEVLNVSSTKTHPTPCEWPPIFLNCPSMSCLMIHETDVWFLRHRCHLYDRAIGHIHRFPSIVVCNNLPLYGANRNRTKHWRNQSNRCTCIPKKPPPCSLWPLDCETKITRADELVSVYRDF
jgi:hypothetical protein